MSNFADTLTPKTISDMDININFNFQMLEQPAGCSGARAEARAEADASLSNVINRQLQQMGTCRGVSTLNNYATATNSLRAYLQTDIPIRQVDENLVCGYERWLLQRGLCLNTVSCYMRSLRSLLAAHDERLKSAFTKVYTGTARTEKRSVALDAVRKLRLLSLPPGTFLELARDVFLFSFYAMGMPLVDVAYLRKSQMTDGGFSYCRRKTGQQVHVAIEPPMADIINRHAPQAAGPFVLPLLTSGSHREYLTLLGRYNRALKRLARTTGVEGRLTSYVVRHTWASTAYRSNVDLPVISKALGHTNPQTTLTYIREIDDQRLFEANRQIINNLMA